MHQPYDPLPHQIEDSDAILKYEHAYLWADPGTGKTVTALEAFRKGGYEKAVIICPKIALDMWREEIHKHLGVPYHLIGILRSARIPQAGTRKNGKKVYPFILRKFIITTPDLAYKFAGNGGDFLYKFVYDEQLKRPPKYSRAKSWYWKHFEEGTETNTVLIIDEAHKFKSVTAKRAQYTLGGPKVPERYALTYPFKDVWQLTGTPITRHADDLYMQLQGQRKEVLRAYGVETYDKFVNEFCTTKIVQYHPRSQPQKVVTGSKNLTTLNQLLDDCKVIKRKLADVWDAMPDITYRQFSADYKGVQATEITLDNAALIRELNKKDSVMAKTYRALGIAKVNSVIEFLTDEEAVPHRPVLVGCWHRDVMAELAAQLTELGLRVAQIHGGTPLNERKAAEDNFNAGEIDFLVGQVKAMGESINLQEKGRHVVLAEQLISSSDLKQFVARVMRRGQKNHVQVDMAMSGHPLDEALLELRATKADVIERVS